MITTLLSLLLFSLTLAHSNALADAYSLPKMAALRFGTLALFLTWCYHYRKGQTRPIPAPVLYTTLLFGAWLFISAQFALNVPAAMHGTPGRENGFWMWFNYLLLFLMAASLPVDRENVLKAFVGSMFIVAAYAIWQYSSGMSRPPSLSGNPVPMAASVAMAVPFAIYFAARHRSFSIVLMGLLSAIAVSESRGPQLGLIASFIVMLTTFLKKRVIAAIAVAAIIVSVVSISMQSSRLTSITERLAYYSMALEMTKDHPIVGVGPDNFKVAFPLYRTPEVGQYGEHLISTQVHNNYLQMLATTGIPGFMLYVTFIMAVMVFIRGEGFLRLAFVAAISSYLVHSTTGWQHVAVDANSWVLMGLGLNREPQDMRKNS